MEEAGIRVGRVRLHSTQPWPFPYSLMIGCIAEGLSDDITVDTKVRGWRGVRGGGVVAARCAGGPVRLAFVGLDRFAAFPPLCFSLLADAPVPRLGFTLDWTVAGCARLAYPAASFMAPACRVVVGAKRRRWRMSAGSPVAT